MSLAKRTILTELPQKKVSQEVLSHFNVIEALQALPYLAYKLMEPTNISWILYQQLSEPWLSTPVLLIVKR